MKVRLINKCIECTAEEPDSHCVIRDEPAGKIFEAKKCTFDGEFCFEYGEEEEDYQEVY